VLIRKSSDALDLLTEAKLVRRFRGAEKSLERLNAGYYIAEMLRVLTDNHDPQPALYDTALAALDQIDGPGNPALALLGFDTAALRLLGLTPTTRRCADCGEPVQPAARQWFAPGAGGVVCERCRGRQHAVMRVPGEALAQLERLLAPHTRIPLAIPPDVYPPLRSLVTRYLQTIVGTTLKMQPFLPARMEPAE
jgi:DNA repair protein RecO (recombination protein O)